MTSVSKYYGHQGSPFARASAIGSAAHGAPVVLMVSGGADSSALLFLAATSRLDIADGRGEARIGKERLHVLHVNHLTRGIDSQEDEEFVAELAERYGIPCRVVRKDVPALVRASHGRSFEEVAREVRYDAAQALANELSDAAGTRHGDARILTAHTADDRAETFFMNVLRGCGTSGLASIPRRRNRIVRPLIDKTHQELCDLLRMHGIVWREDATNACERYLRNYVRHELMAPAKERNPQLVAALASTCDILGDENSYLHGRAQEALREITVSERDGARVLSAQKLSAMEVAIARRVMREAILSVEPLARLEARHINRALTLVAKGSGSLTTPMGVDVAVDHGVLDIRARRAQRPLGGGWLSVPGELLLEGEQAVSASLRTAAALGDPVAAARAFGLEHEGQAVMLDAAACGHGDPAATAAHWESGALRLWVGPATLGELMQPLGMGGHSKRVSDLIAEAGIPQRERAFVPVVRTEPQGTVIWVCGIRADERARVTESTKTLLLLRLREQLAEGSSRAGCGGGAGHGSL